jgi:hypothetical protein
MSSFYGWSRFKVNADGVKASLPRPAPDNRATSGSDAPPTAQVATAKSAEGTHAHIADGTVCGGGQLIRDGGMACGAVRVPEVITTTAYEPVLKLRSVKPDIESRRSTRHVPHLRANYYESALISDTLSLSRDNNSCRWTLKVGVRGIAFRRS